MSVSPVRQLEQKSNFSPTAPASSKRWIVSAWIDQVLIVLTPILIVPILYFVYSPWVGVNAETIGLIVTAFFALGHHLPGMIRAYGDRDLFQRFQWRFILAPPILFSVFFPLNHYHYSAVRLITLIWATWHGLMQLYGFVRIYDMKVGSTSRVTANWDWLMCLSWFITAQIVSPGGMANMLDHWYAIGGPLIPPLAVQGFQWLCLAISVGVLVGFSVNFLVQTQRGQRPNPIKLLMLASGISFWWFAMVFVENIILGVAMFDISHDVQYLVIVWLYNCRRVNSNPNVGKFMKFVFRRGMVLLYLGLIVAYGAIGLVPGLVQDDSVKTFFMGFLWTSTILHYYMDGFIWKVREPATRASLGLNEVSTPSRAPQFDRSGLIHLLKWSPLALFIGWLFFTDLNDGAISATRAQELKKLYIEQLSSSSKLPSNQEEQSWLYTQFKQVQNISAAVPENRMAQIRAATILANFGQHKEAVAILEKQLARDPTYANGDLVLGAIYLKTGNLDAALTAFEKAQTHSSTIDQRTDAMLKMGHVYLLQNETELAKAKFTEAVQANPKLQESIDALRKLDKPLESPQSTSP